jgi:hypothetical protein
MPERIRYSTVLSDEILIVGGVIIAERDESCVSAQGLW